jgi:pyroglutamyl-peptidase
MKKRVLITGFEAFGEVARNPSASLVQRLQGGTVAGHGVVGAVLPVVFGKSGDLLRELIRENDPVLVLCLGVAASRRVLSLERVAVNLDDAPIADNEGQQPVDLPVVEGGPAAYFSTLPLKAIWTAWQRRGWASEVSATAGSYVCNHVFYHLMHALRRRCAVSAGFVHVPRPRPGLRLGDMEAALRDLITISLRRRRDLTRAAGRVD